MQAKFSPISGKEKGGGGRDNVGEGSDRQRCFVHFIRRFSKRNTENCAKNSRFSAMSEKIHKIFRESIVNFTLVSSRQIGYNVVTKVTNDCF